jgi:hypothetical protein
LTARLVRNFGTPSRNAYPLTVDKGETTGTGAQNDDCTITTLMGSKPRDIGVSF